MSQVNPNRQPGSAGKPDQTREQQQRAENPKTAGAPRDTNPRPADEARNREARQNQNPNEQQQRDR